MITAKQFLIACITLFLLGFEAKAQISEIKINNEIYLYKKEGSDVYNKKNTITDVLRNQNNCHFSVVGKLSFTAACKDIFSLEKVQTLAKEKKSIMFTYYCDSTGTILEVSFYLRKMSLETITGAEINALEQVIVGSKIELSGTCEDVKYYRLIQSFRFEDLLEEMLKSKAAQSVS